MNISYFDNFLALWIVLSFGEFCIVLISLSDHLGNSRVLFSDLNKDGKIDGSEVLQENHYYPFGMNMEGPWCADAVNSTKNHYQFNGIELFEDLDLNVNFAFYRSYDAALGRWWQVDPKAESFYGMTVYNGMGNNPVLLSDPNGDSPLISAGISVLTNGIQNLINGDNFFKGGLQAAVMGFIGGGISMGIGDAFGGVGNVGKELLRAGAHGLSGGLQSAMSGSNFWHGFANGGISSGIGSGLHKASGAVQLFGSGLSGGLGSAIAGGNFWQGAGMGLTVAGLNHLGDKLIDDIRTKHNYKKLFQGEDQTCLMACGAMMTGMTVEEFKDFYIKNGGEWTKDGAIISSFLAVTGLQSTKNLKTVMLDMDKGGHAIGLFNDGPGWHGVLMTRVRTYTSGKVKVTFINPSIGGSVTYQFKNMDFEGWGFANWSK